MQWAELVSAKDDSFWRYHRLLPPVEASFRLTLGEKTTPLLEKDGILFKREDQNPTGSVKDRGIFYSLSRACQKGVRGLVIPSSGNAAVSLAAYAGEIGLPVTAFVPFWIRAGKKKALEALGAKIVYSQKTVTEASRLAASYGLVNLRPSVDRFGHLGYATLAFELFEQSLKLPDAIFLPVSSGTTLLGVGEGFEKLRALGFVTRLPQLHAVQTFAAHGLTEDFLSPAERKKLKDKKLYPRQSLADALVARSTPRKAALLKLIRRSGARGWVMGEEAIKKAWDFLLEGGLETSAEGAVALSGLWQAKENGWEFERPLVVLTGKKHD